MAPDSITHSPEGGPRIDMLFMVAISPKASHDGDVVGSIGVGSEENNRVYIV